MSKRYAVIQANEWRLIGVGDLADWRLQDMRDIHVLSRHALLADAQSACASWNYLTYRASQTDPRRA